MKEELLMSEPLRLLVAAIGFACLVTGSAMILAPLGWIVGGLGCLFVAIDAKARS